MREFHAVCGRMLAGFFEAMLIQTFVCSTASPTPASAPSSQLRATVSDSLETSRVNLLIHLPATYAKAAGYRTVNASPFATLLNFIFVVMLYSPRPTPIWLPRGALSTAVNTADHLDRLYAVL